MILKPARFNFDLRACGQTLTVLAVGVCAFFGKGQVLFWRQIPPFLLKALSILYIFCYNVSESTTEPFLGAYI